MSSEEVPSLPKSLPSSREATAEGGSSASGSAGYMPLREFLDRFSLPRVVRLEGTGGRPVLLYKQQQRSLRVTASLLIHRYRHDVKVGPEIVIPEGYPGEFLLRIGRSMRSHDCAPGCEEIADLLAEDYRSGRRHNRKSTLRVELPKNVRVYDYDRTFLGKRFICRYPPISWLLDPPINCTYETL